MDMASTLGLLEQAKHIEGELRSLAARAARGGNWRVVRAVSTAAEQLEAIQPGTPKADKPNAHEVAKSSRKGGVTPRVPRTTGYPRFARAGLELVKVGWSKSEKAEYRHRAARGSVDLMVSAILAEIGSTGRFSTDSLFPVIDPKDGEALPDYQAYLVLRWLREIEIVLPKGRSAYVVSVPESITENVERAWQSLPEDNPETSASGDR